MGREALSALSHVARLVATGRSDWGKGTTGCLFSGFRTSRWNVSIRSKAASRKGNLWTAAQRSRTLPPTPKSGENQRNTFFSMFAENERL